MSMKNYELQRVWNGVFGQRVGMDTELTIRRIHMARVNLPIGVMRKMACKIVPRSCKSYGALRAG